MKKKYFIFFLLCIINSQNIHPVEPRYKFINNSVYFVETDTKYVSYMNGEYIGESEVTENSTFMVKLLGDGQAWIDCSAYLLEKRKPERYGYYKAVRKSDYNFYKNIYGKTFGLGNVMGIHNFPIFPKKNLKIGDSWISNSYMVVPLFNNNIDAKFEIVVNYRYIGTERKEGKNLILIFANSVFAKDKNKNIFKSFQLFNVTGYNNFLIKFDLNTGQIYSIEENFDYLFVTYNGTLVETSGVSFSKYRIAENIEIIEELEKINKKDEILIKVRKDKSVSITLQNIKFLPDSKILTDEEKKRLDKLARILSRKYNNRKLMIIGHTADIGKPKSQLKLSEERARVVLEYLVDKHGFNPKIMSYEGRGGTEPVADNANEKGRKKNRRVEIIILP